MAKKSQKSAAPAAPVAAPSQLANPYLTAFLAWFFPGAGHFFVGERRRGILLGGLILLCLGLGCGLQGLLLWQTSGSPLLMLGTFGSVGAGAPLLALKFVVGYEGDPTAAGFEYGASFLLSAGLLNWLLVLDAWDRAWGRKSSLVDGIEESDENPVEGQAV